MKINDELHRNSSQGVSTDKPILLLCALYNETGERLIESMPVTLSLTNTCLLCARHLAYSWRWGTVSFCEGVDNLMEEADITTHLLQQQNDTGVSKIYPGKTNCWYFVIAALISDCQLNIAYDFSYFFQLESKRYVTVNGALSITSTLVTSHLCLQGVFSEP